MRTHESPYHEDFHPGLEVTHRRGHTIAVEDNQLLSLLTMNTAETHFNAHSLRAYMDGAFEAPLLNACVALALAVGLTSEDMTVNALADLGYDGFQMPSPLAVGDTLYASSEVVATDEPSGREDAGVLRYRITARVPDDERVALKVERRVLIKRRSAWAERDRAFSGRVHGAAAAALRAGER
jgi:acyl dehydratase